MSGSALLETPASPLFGNPVVSDLAAVRPLCRWQFNAGAPLFQCGGAGHPKVNIASGESEGRGAIRRTGRKLHCRVAVLQELAEVFGL
jgi:hypothetical protein